VRPVGPKRDGKGAAAVPRRLDIAGVINAQASPLGANGDVGIWVLSGTLNYQETAEGLV